MKFADLHKKFKKEAYATSLESHKTEATEGRIVDAWMVHQTIETNKRLVSATWVLAIATIALSIISLFTK